MTVHPVCTYIMLISYAIDATHSVDRGERCAERGVHSLPYARWAAGPVNYGGGVRAGDRPGCVGKSSWPE